MFIESASPDPVANLNYLEYCDTITNFKSLSIKNIEAKIELEEEKYDAKVSVYYVPDSILFLSAVNTGFEIVRIGITKDSTVYINRIDKIVVIIKERENGYGTPLNFNDIQLLINKLKLCQKATNFVKTDEGVLLDRSIQDIAKKIYLNSEVFALEKFEFFHKKTGEYVVGEKLAKNEFLVYANFIVDDLTISTTGGDLERNKMQDVNLNFNTRKYSVLYY